MSLKCFVGHPRVNRRQLKCEDLESFPEKVSDADLRIISTPIPILGRFMWPGISFPKFPGHSEQQQCFERQYKKKGQLSFTKESPKYAAREENRESWDTGENTG